MTHIMFEVKIGKKWVMIPKEDRVWKSVTSVSGRKDCIVTNRPNRDIVRYLVTEDKSK